MLGICCWEEPPADTGATLGAIVVPRFVPDDGTFNEDTDVLVMLLLGSILLLPLLLAIVLLLLLETLLLATVLPVLPKGAGNPLAGDCKICTGGRSGAAGLGLPADDELLLVAPEPGFWPP